APVGGTGGGGIAELGLGQTRGEKERVVGARRVGPPGRERLEGLGRRAVVAGGHQRRGAIEGGVGLVGCGRSRRQEEEEREGGERGGLHGRSMPSARSFLC